MKQHAAATIVATLRFFTYQIVHGSALTTLSGPCSKCAMADLATRIARYRAIEEYRKRPLITYATSTRFGVRALMGADSVREFIDQIDAITEGDSVDVLLHSAGGDALAAWKLMSLLRERFKNVAVLVPSAAFSAATLFALGADSIVMHPHSSLGPIDPQVVVQTPDGQQKQFGYEDVTAFLRFIVEQVRVTEQAHTSTAAEKLFSSVDPVLIGAAKRASDLSTAVGERLLSMHMTSPERKQEAKQIAIDLNKSFFAHGDAISRTRARSLLKHVADDDPKLERLIWDAFLGIEEHMELRKPFLHLNHFASTPGGRAAISVPPPLNLPPNTPDPAANAAWNAVLNRTLQTTGTPCEVEYELSTMLLESPRVASENRTKGIVAAFRRGVDLQMTVTDISTGWRSVPLSGSAAPSSTGGGQALALNEFSLISAVSDGSHTD